MEIRPVKWIVVNKDAPIFDESAFEVEIIDEDAGEFITVTQDDNEIRIDDTDWPMLKLAIDQAIKQCREEKQ